MSAIKLAMMGKSKSELSWSLRNIPNLTKSDQEYLDGYYLKYWAPEFFKLCNDNGVLIDSDLNTYNICYSLCTPEELRIYKQVKLSFRRPKEFTGLPNIVLVSVDRSCANINLERLKTK